MYKYHVLDFYILSGKVSLVSRVYVERFIIVTTLSHCRVPDPGGFRSDPDPVFE